MIIKITIKNNHKTLNQGMQPTFDVIKYNF